MSHTSEIGTVAITDVSALQSAIAELKQAGVNCDLVQNAQPRMYYTGQHGQCDYVLKLHGCDYDVGFDRQPDGSYKPVTDLWQGKVSQHLGASCPVPDSPAGRAQHAIGRLMNGYSKHAAINVARRKGHTVKRVIQGEDGSVRLVLGA